MDDKPLMSPGKPFIIVRSPSGPMIGGESQSQGDFSESFPWFIFHFDEQSRSGSSSIQYFQNILTPCSTAMEDQSEDEDDKSNKAQGKKDYDNIISHLREFSFRGLLLSCIIPETSGVKIYQKMIMRC